MKKYLSLLLWTLLLLAPASFAAAQEYSQVPVTVSKEKVRLNGRIYYSHPVQERQTLFSIAKVYGVSVEDLYAANPELRENGLQNGTRILIPAEGVSAPAESAPQGYVEHTVMWYEDLEDIAAQYGVTPQEIMDLNKMKSRKVTKRQVLRIPVKGSGLAAAAPVGQDQPKQEEKTVAPPEVPTLADPVISDPEYATGTSYKPLKVDKIKVKKAKEKEVAPPEIPTIEDPVIGDPELAEPGQYRPVTVDPLTVDPAAKLEKEEEEDDNIFDWLTGKGSVDLALVLPFNAGGNYSETNMDFYSGVLLAVRDLQAEGIKVNLNVYDFQAGLPSSFELGKNDFILGPVTAADLSSVLDRAGETPVISPLDQRAATLGDTHRNFIQVPSAAASQYEDLAAWAAEGLGRSDRIILVSEKVSGSTAPAVGVRNALLEAGTPFEGISFTLGELRALPASLTALLTKGGVNRIIVASEKEGFVADLVRDLGILRGRGYQVEMYAPSRVRTFDSVEGTAYHQCALHICSSYFVDYADSRTRSFVRTYRALFRTEPSQFAFQGYDTARYFASLAGKYGNRWTKALTRVDGKGLHTDFRFETAPGGAFHNTAVRRIVYRTDYSTELDR